MVRAHFLNTVPEEGPTVMFNALTYHFLFVNFHGVVVCVLGIVKAGSLPTYQQG